MWAHIRRKLPARWVELAPGARKRALDRDKRNKGRTNKEIFSEIYSQGKWGRGADPDSPYSGSGSHTPEIVDRYVAAVKGFWDRFDGPMTLVDLGCGDFSVGSKLLAGARRYIACDIVDSVIEYNKRTYLQANLEFVVLDLCNDPLPDGDVFLVRQVLQHLQNADIAKFCRKVEAKGGYLILTEHVPVGEFAPNLDKASGAAIRLFKRSGVVLTQPPFDLRVMSEQVICEVPQMGGVVRTVVYRL